MVKIMRAVAVKANEVLWLLLFLLLAMSEGVLINRDDTLTR